MKKAFGAIMIAVILIVCVVTLTVQRGENAMLEFPERPAEGCTVLSLEITDGKAQTEVIGTYNVNENVLTMNTSALENAEPTESGENYTYTLPESIPKHRFVWTQTAVRDMYQWNCIVLKGGQWKKLKLGIVRST